jgi:hypothetical protein
MFDFFTYFIYLSLLTTLIFLTGYKQKLSTAELDFAITQKLRIQHFAALIVISFVVGFRYEVGVDWESYKDVFLSIKSNPNLTQNDQYMEIGYFFINQVIARVGLSYGWMFFVTALISWFFIYKSVPKIILPLLIFFLFVDEYFFWSMNGVRQFAAISIFLFSIRFIIQGKLRNYIFFILFASLFHYSVLLLFPIYFIPFNKIYNQKFWIFAFVLSFIFSKTPFLIDGLKALLSILGTYIPLISNYLFYLEGVNYESRELAGSGLGVIFRGLITLFILFYSNPIIKKYPQTTVYFVLFFLGAIIYNLFFSFQIVGRFNNYFVIMRTVVLALITFELLKKTSTRFVAIGIMVLYLLIFLVAIYNSSNLCSPYNFSFL